jgi:hypothetical protein
LKELFDRLMPTALYAGIGVREFWGMTPAEIIAMIQAHSRRRTDELKARTADIYNIAVLVNKSLCGNLKSLYREFPELYKEEAQKEELARFKEYMMKYARTNNARREAEKLGG